MASSGVAPPSGGAGGGGAAAAVGNAALHGAQRGAAIAQKGVVNLTIYVQRRWLDSYHLVMTDIAVENHHLYTFIVDFSIVIWI